MTISSEMEEPLFALALAAARTPDEALREQLVIAQQRFEELRLAVMRLEELCGIAERASPAVMVPPHLAPQREAQPDDLAAGVVDLRMYRAARAGGAVRL